MNTKQPISIDLLLRDSALTVIQLKEKAEMIDLGQLHKSCKQQVISLRETLKTAQYDQEVIDDISYAQCALLDETVLLYSKGNEGQQNNHEWRGEPLQVIFFNTHNAGDELFQTIRKSLKEGNKDKLVLECFDRVLGLGFQGIYLDKPQTEREYLYLALREAIQYKPLPHGYSIVEYNRVHHHLGKKTLFIVITVMAVLATILLYFILDHALDDLIAPLLESVATKE